MIFTARTKSGIWSTPLVKVVNVYPRVRVVWDDENPDFGFKSRTQLPEWGTLESPPAVYRYFKNPIDDEGDFRVDLASSYNWKPAILALNGNDQQKFDYLVGPDRATYNHTGWPMQAYITMSGNILEGVFLGDWFCFYTLKPRDYDIVAGWTIKDHPQYIHRFTCVTWDAQNKTTKRINSTGTPRGDVFYYLVTKEGIGYIPRRHVVKV